MGSYFMRLIFQAVLRGFFSVTWEGGGGRGRERSQAGQAVAQRMEREGDMPDGAITAMSGLVRQ